MTFGRVPNGEDFTDDRGTTFTPVVDLDIGAVGYRCERNGVVTYIYFNPSNADEDTPPSNVFVYSGAHGDPSNDESLHWYSVEEDA